MLWRVSRPIRTRSKPPGFILPCQPALADRAPAGLGWLHEIKFDGYRVIARKDGKRVRLWARTTSDYSSAFARIREAVAALPVDNAVLDGEAILLQPYNTPGDPVPPRGTVAAEVAAGMRLEEGRPERVDLNLYPGRSWCRREDRHQFFRVRPRTADQRPRRAHLRTSDHRRDQ
jgi:hypothetical protein